MPIGDVEARAPPSKTLDHPQRSQQWAEEAEASVRTEFTVDAMVDALEVLYAKLLA